MSYGDLSRANNKRCDGIRLNGLMTEGLIEAMNVRTLAAGMRKVEI